MHIMQSFETDTGFQAAAWFLEGIHRDDTTGKVTAILKPFKDAAARAALKKAINSAVRLVELPEGAISDAAMVEPLIDVVLLSPEFQGAVKVE